MEEKLVKVRKALTIFLYFFDIVPHVMFLDQQFLFAKAV